MSPMTTRTSAPTATTAVGHAQRRSRSMIRSRPKSRRMLRAMPEFAVTAIGRDRPGIVAAISGALLELQGNIEDSQMAILRGHFAVMLIVKLPEAADSGDLEARLQRVRQELELEEIAVNRVDDLGEAATHPTHVISVYGAGHPGI